jgi:hypothetical protein
MKMEMGKYDCTIEGSNEIASSNNHTVSKDSEIIMVWDSTTLPEDQKAVDIIEIFHWGLLIIGPTCVADSLFFWKKRNVLRKQLVSSPVPIVMHIVHRRQSHEKFFVSFGYHMDKVAYERQVSERFYELTKHKNTVNLPVSSSYPESGPHYALPVKGYENDSLCKVCGWFFFGSLFTLFVTYVLGRFAVLCNGGAPTLLGYPAVAGVLLLAGYLIAAMFHSDWRNETLYAYQVVHELPSKMIDDNAGLEMGMHAVQEDDGETLAPTEESASIRSLDETDFLEIPSTMD